MEIQLVSELVFLVLFCQKAHTSAGACSGKLTSFGSHIIGGCNSPEDNDISIDTFVSHDSHSSTRIKRSKCLGNLVVQSSLTNL